MEDQRIIELYWQRASEAIEATREKYSAYCAAVARNILPSAEDVEECLNDTWLQVWNTIPPQRPQYLKAFLAKITRNLAINRYTHIHAQKRGGGELPLVLDELAEVIPDSASVEQAVEACELSEALRTFVAGLPDRQRRLFVCRYWYADSVKTIAKVHGMTVGAVTMQLSRTRKQLHTYLTERGFDL